MTLVLWLERCLGQERGPANVWEACIPQDHLVCRQTQRSVDDGHKHNLSRHQSHTSLDNKYCADSLAATGSSSRRRWYSVDGSSMNGPVLRSLGVGDHGAALPPATCCTLSLSLALLNMRRLSVRPPRTPPLSPSDTHPGKPQWFGKTELWTLPGPAPMQLPTSPRLPDRACRSESTTHHNGTVLQTKFKCVRLFLCLLPVVLLLLRSITIALIFVLSCLSTTTSQCCKNNNISQTQHRRLSTLCSAQHPLNPHLRTRYCKDGLTTITSALSTRPKTRAPPSPLPRNAQLRALHQPQRPLRDQHRLSRLLQLSAIPH